MSDPIEEALSAPPTVEDAANAAVDTAKSTIEWEGQTFTVPTEVERIPARAVLALEKEHGLMFIEGVLGSTGLERAFDAFEKNHGHTPDVKEITPFVDLIAKQLGFEDAGN